MTPGSTPLPRRQFLERSVRYGGVLYAMLSLPRPVTLGALQQGAVEPVVFTEHQWRTVEAITGRIIPTDEVAGAIEANCVNFIDKALANEDSGLRELYEAALPGVDIVARERFGREFRVLDEVQQDRALIAIEAGDTAAWPAESAAPQEFFDVIRAHTILGFLADPKYGGNRDYAGWRVVGFPGPRHHVGGYTPGQMIGREPIRPIWEGR